MGNLVLSFILSCVQTETANSFGVVTTQPEQSSVATPDSGSQDSAVEERSEYPSSTPADPFAIDDTEVCGGRTVGIEVGNCAKNFHLIDRNEALVSLHSFAGSIIFLDLSGFG